MKQKSFGVSMALMGILVPTSNAAKPVISDTTKVVAQLFNCADCQSYSHQRKPNFVQSSFRHHPTPEQKLEPGKLEPRESKQQRSQHQKSQHQKSQHQKSQKKAEASSNPRVRHRMTAPDPELGDLRLQEQDLAIEQTAEAGNIADSDPELGNLRLRERELAVNRQHINSVFLLGRVDYFNSNNILLDDFDPVNDQIATAGLSLLAVPNLGQHTQLIASISGDIARYHDLTDLSYNDLELRAGIRQWLFPRTYGEISWKNSQFFDANTGDRFLNDHSIFFSLSHRENLTPQLSFDGFYELRLGFSNPNDRSRITNQFGASLNYDVQQNLDVGLDYQFFLTDFTQHDQQDSYHQVTAEVSYDINSNSRVSIYGGFSFGQSSDPTINFNSAVFGAVFDVSVPLF